MNIKKKKLPHLDFDNKEIQQELSLSDFYIPSDVRPSLEDSSLDRTFLSFYKDENSIDKLAKVFNCDFAIRKTESNKKLAEEEIDPEIEKSLREMDEKTLSLIDEDQSEDKRFLKRNQSTLNEISVTSTEDSKQKLSISQRFKQKK